jgi:hypothetical protein
MEKTMSHASSRTLGSFLFALVLSAGLVAQTLTVPDPLVGGTAATISYSDPASAGKTITVTVSGGLPAVTHNLVITLDSSGKGQTTWVPELGWRWATFQAPGVPSQQHPIT